MAELIVATILRPAGDTGVQTHFRTFLRWLEQEETAATLVTPYSSPKWLVYPTFAPRKLLDRLNGTLSVWWYRHWHEVFVERALRRLLRRGQDCVIYAQCPLSAVAALRARRSPRQRVVMVVHFNVSQADEWVQKGMIAADGDYATSIRNFEQDTLSTLDGLVFVSDFMRRTLTNRYPALRKIPSEVISNFVVDPGTPRAANSVDADLITIGTLEPRKNQVYALEIIAAARQRGLHLSLSVVGDGPDRTVLRARARELGIEGRVRFLGYLPDAARLIKRHRAYMHVARMESQGLVLIEALAHGRPVFAPAVGGIPEVLTDGITGQFLPLDDAEGAAAVLARWFVDAPEALEKAGSPARSSFLTRFDAERVARQLHDFLQRRQAP